MTDAAATRLAAKLKTPLQIGQHLVRAFERCLSYCASDSRFRLR